jgi:hypothetical protein
MRGTLSLVTGHDDLPVSLLLPSTEHEDSGFFCFFAVSPVSRRPDN